MQNYTSFGCRRSKTELQELACPQATRFQPRSSEHCCQAWQADISVNHSENCREVARDFFHASKNAVEPAGFFGQRTSGNLSVSVSQQEFSPTLALGRRFCGKNKMLKQILEEKTQAVRKKRSNVSSSNELS